MRTREARRGRIKGPSAGQASGPGGAANAAATRKAMLKVSGVVEFSGWGAIR